MEQRESQDKTVRKLKKQLDDYVKKVEEYESKRYLWSPSSRPDPDQEISWFPHVENKKIPQKSPRMKDSVALPAATLNSVENRGFGSTNAAVFLCFSSSPADEQHVLVGPSCECGEHLAEGAGTLGHVGVQGNRRELPAEDPGHG